MAWQGRASRLGEDKVRDEEEGKPRLTKDGVEIDMSCPHCSAFSPVLIEWPEVVALAQGACPEGFERTVAGHTFSILCPRCVKHYQTSGKAFEVEAGMSREEATAAKLRQREVSMSRPVGMETVARWLAAARACGFVR